MKENIANISEYWQIILQTEYSRKPPKTKLVFYTENSTVLDNDTENVLATCIGSLCQVGFSPSAKKNKNLVAEYLSKNKIDASAFTDGKPGKHWLAAFMKRSNL